MLLFLAQKLLKRCCLHRTVIVIALGDVAANILEYFYLYLGFHSFAYDLHPQLRGHVHQIFNDNLLPRSLKPGTYKAAVQFEDIRPQPLQLPQGGISGAEIIYGHPVAVRPQPVNQLLGSGKFSSVRAEDTLSGASAIALSVISTSSR